MNLYACIHNVNESTRMHAEGAGPALPLRQRHRAGQRGAVFRPRPPAYHDLDRAPNPLD